MRGAISQSCHTGGNALDHRTCTLSDVDVGTIYVLWSSPSLLFHLVALLVARGTGRSCWPAPTLVSRSR